MAKWVMRRTILAVSDYVEELLEDGERVELRAQRTQIMRGEQLVGFIDVTDTHP